MRGQFEARSRPVWSRTATGVTTTPVAIYIPDMVRKLIIVPTGRTFVQTGPLEAAPAVTAVNGITTIATYGTPTGGTFKLTAFPGQRNAQETSALTYDESAADIVTALAALTVFDTGDLTGGGGALPTAVTLTWAGVYAAAVPPLIASSVALTGGANSSIRVWTSTAPLGNGGYGYAETTGMTITPSNDEVGTADRFLYVAAVASTIDYFLTGYA